MATASCKLCFCMKFCQFNQRFAACETRMKSKSFFCHNLPNDGHYNTKKKSFRFADVSLSKKKEVQGRNTQCSNRLTANDNFIQKKVKSLPFASLMSLFSHIKTNFRSSLHHLTCESPSDHKVLWPTNY